MRLLALALVAACSAPAAPPVRTPVTQPVVPATPAAVAVTTQTTAPTLRLPKTFVEKSVAATLAIDPAKTGFSGSIALTGEVTEAAPVIWLHGKGLTIAKATANGAPITATPRGEDLLELRGAFTPGPLVLALDYTGSYALIETAGAFKQTSNGASYVITQFEAIYARKAFPCIDEPDTKVPWKLTLDVPAGNIAVANTAVEKESKLPDGRKRFEFQTTKPLPSYLIAFGVGPFDIVDGGKTKSGVPVRIITMKGRAAEAAWAAQTTARILDLEEKWFDIPYPFGKLDMLTIPLTVGFGAMENPGLITTTDRLIMVDPKNASWGERRAYVSVTAHEIAHQWFGDYVTMAFWDDIWLNEGFADWLGHKITVQFEPAWHDESRELDERLEALAADSLVTARRVREPIKSSDDISNVFDRITYQKGATILNMFEAYVGAEKFRAGVRDYLTSRAFGNATSTDFIAAVSKASGTDLAPAMSTFLDQGGAPELDISVKCGKGKPEVTLAQHRYVEAGSPEAPPTKPWIVPVCLAYEQGGKRAEACTQLSASTGTLELAGKCPRWIMGNVGGRGYYRTFYPAKAATALRDEAWPLLTNVERRALFLTLDDELTNGKAKLPLSLVLSYVPRMLANGDRYSVQSATEFAGSYLYAVPDDLHPKYEAWLRATFGAGAAKVGLLPRANDDLDAESVRKSLVYTVGWLGQDPDLARQSVELAANWRDLPSATRGYILKIAANASSDIHAKLLHDIKGERDRAHRQEMYIALGSVRDAKRYEAALELTLDPAIDFREAQALFYAASNNAMRAVSERFARAHKDALFARLPKESVTGGIGGLYIRLLKASCDASKRADVEKYLRDNFEAMPGGKREIAQGLESMDQCIVQRAQLMPSLRGWLSGVKIPKPAKP
jgi:alanyl aminopeptidase